MSARQGSWRAIGESVIGVTHARDGRPCQDAVWTSVTSPEVAVAAVADGHGQAKSFRSGEGASIAVKVAADLLAKFSESDSAMPDSAWRERKDLAGHLPRIVAQTWRERVREHVQRHPLSVDEHVLVGDRLWTAPDQPMTPDAYRSLWRVYGTTLIAVLVTRSYAVALQIGDGLLMAAGASGEAFEVLDPDALNFGTSTTSLSDEDAELRLRWRLIPHEGDYPVLYWLSTDGYEKAFRSEDHGGVCLEYREAFRGQDGYKIINENLAAGLHQASAGGTGDDATAAFLYFDESDSGSVTAEIGRPPQAETDQGSAGVTPFRDAGTADDFVNGEHSMNTQVTDASTGESVNSSFPLTAGEGRVIDSLGPSGPSSPTDPSTRTPDGEEFEPC